MLNRNSRKNLAQKHLKKKEHELQDVTGKDKLVSGFNSHFLKSQSGKVINASVIQNWTTGIPGKLSLGLDFISNG
jgi:hypothetical protein